MTHPLLESSPVFQVIAERVAGDEERRPLSGLKHAQRLLANAVGQLEHDIAAGKRIDLSCVHRQTLLQIVAVGTQALRQFKLETAADAIDQDIPF